jgi:hypothetical protein
MKTLFAGSSCNDAVALDSQCIISGHLDRKVRFWDGRKDQTHHEIVLEGKVTSLDLSQSNGNSVNSTARNRFNFRSSILKTEIICLQIHVMPMD